MILKKLGLYTSRRLIRWEKVRDTKTRLALGIGTALGAGLLPLAPGTMGTLVGVPIAYFTNSWEWPWRVALWGGLTILGTWAAQVFDQTMGTKDNQNIVIDEVVGFGITAWTAGHDFKTLLAAFVLFRFFDVLKPPPVRQMDGWSKKQASPTWEGFGVMADDMIAGFQGLGLILLLQWLDILPPPHFMVR
jgi:phosphatidylglycerophosphatase A